ncbi:MAG: acyl-CoA mutase large subunit family protein [Actinomycetota bacterium]
MTEDDARARWKAAYRAAGDPAPARTFSGTPLEPVYTPDDVPDLDHDRDLGFPGAFPMARGVYPSMYLGRRWTMRQFAGFGSPAETNARFRYLLEHGQTGLSVAFDLPTLMGRDSDDAFSKGEVGRCGVAVDSLADMDTLFDRIPLGDVTTSMTINGPAVIVFAMFLAAAERQGVPWSELGGTLQTDIFKEYIAQREWLYPPRPHLRLIGDLIEFCAREVPRFHPISISGYHIREAGSTAVQELAFTLADGLAYVELGMQRGMAVDAFAPRLSFFFNAHIDLFEEIAKFRAARRIWARRLRDRYGATDERSLRLRFHTQTAGCSLTAEQPENNIVRTAVEALAAVMGGTQSLHTNSLDEVFALPTDRAVTIALRTQQILAEETGVANVIDPLGGSYFVEALTDRVEADAEAYLETIESMGGGSIYEGVLKGIDTGYFMSEIADAAFREQQRFDAQELIRVGVNRYRVEDEPPLEMLEIPIETERTKVAELAGVRATRDAARVDAALAELTRVAATDGNVMPSLLECARASCTEGEMVGAMRAVFGSHPETIRI